MTGHEYEEGLREGRLVSLESAVSHLTKDVNTLKAAIWMLYGAIALMQFLPELEHYVGK